MLYQEGCSMNRCRKPKLYKEIYFHPLQTPSLLLIIKENNSIELNAIENTKHDYQLIDNENKRKYLISELEKK